MELRKYESHEQYVKIQRKADRNKSRRTSAKMEELAQLSEYLIRTKGPPASGICHGARYGVEVQMFRELLGECDVIGTDLIHDHPGLVVNADFHIQREEWVGAFDFLYSNALDHSHSPEECMRVWMEQLKPDGLAFIMWSTFHIRSTKDGCFGASLYEYMELANRVGRVVDLIYCSECKRTRWNLKTLIVVAPRSVESKGVQR